MTKKQASHSIRLYFLCAALVLGVGVLLVVQKKQEIDLENYKPKLAYVESIELTPLPEEIQSQFVMKQLFNAAEKFSIDVFQPMDHAYELTQEYSFSSFEKLSQEPLDTANIARVVIIIDDMGINHHWSREASKLQAPMTLSYLPYAEDLQAQVDFAAARDHDLMLHMPMQAMNGAMETTPKLLRVSDTQDSFTNNFMDNLNAFEGFSGVNNHMGSLLTQDELKMTLVMQMLKQRGLYFIDSKTIHSSVAGSTAAQIGVPHLVRDVFLDHEDNIEYVRAALVKLENKARKNGAAIAIGHPKKATILALQEWLPTIAQKNIQLIGAKDLIRKQYPLADIKPYEKGRAVISKNDFVVN